MAFPDSYTLPRIVIETTMFFARLQLNLVTDLFQRISSLLDIVMEL